ncbi:lysylphosphatidylglycerol synthase transmembrane domain-containing protein, partial [Luedemannella flava]|uniref:lysylphosphatidylglycerol synthase transmembrane domain-containing protein n=1 Tax=Luedemannella flava TaxID=349316 RepID=UPI0031D1C2FB
WAWARAAVGVGILGLVAWRLGAGPFVAAVRAVDGVALVAAVSLGAVTTVCCAWRWRAIAAGLGVTLPWAGAVAAYYRSQFLNATLPGGVVGDVHRAVRHGRDIGDVRLGVRAVVLERLAAQPVHVAVGVVVLTTFPSPVRGYMPWVAGGVVVAAAVAVAWGWRRPTRIPRSAWARALAASTVVVLGHLATFVIAARAVGATAPLTQLLPLTLLALLAMGVPLNIAGWGPREGVAAWAFGAAGLTAAQGVATSVTYGVLTLVASLPGAVVLAAWSVRRGGARG